VTDPFHTTTKRGEILRKALARFPELDISAIETQVALEHTAEIATAFVFTPLEEHGISRGRFQIMMYVTMEEMVGNEPPSPSGIADSLGVTRATITQLLDGLERDQLVERRDVRNDRRAQAIHLTEKGRRLFDELVPSISCRIARFCSPLSPSERQTLRKLLTKLAKQDPASPGR
jgi:DNA-binding MarR family transcriptional regulator